MSKDKKFPKFVSDKAVEAFVEQEDLSEYDFSGFKPMGEVFEFEPKNKSTHLRLSENLLKEIKSAAADEGLPYQR